MHGSMAGLVKPRCGAGVTSTGGYGPTAVDRSSPQSACHGVECSAILHGLRHEPQRPLRQRSLQRRSDLPRR